MQFIIKSFVNSFQKSSTLFLWFEEKNWAIEITVLSLKII